MPARSFSRSAKDSTPRMASLTSYAFRWVACLQFIVLLSACNHAAPAAMAATPTTTPVSRRSLWTNTFPPIENNGAALRFTHYGLDQGLSQSSAMSIVQDNLGFL